MRFRTRAFLICFLPFAVLLTLSFWMIQGLVQSTVRDRVRSSLRENHLAVARVRSKSDLHNSRFLGVAGENPALKAGVQLLLSDRSPAARATVEDQLMELCEHMGFDLLVVSAPNGLPLAGVMRKNGYLSPLSLSGFAVIREGLLPAGERIFQIASVPLDQSEDNIGVLSVGEYFDFSEFSTPAVLLRDGRLVQSSIPGLPLSEVNLALKDCLGSGECDVKLRGVTYISLPMQAVVLGGGYMLRSLQDLDSATAPVESALHRFFMIVSLGAVGIALLFSVASSQTIVKPLAAVVSELRATEHTGVLPEFRDNISPIREIRDLAESFNRAGSAVREAKDNLQGAYLEFVQSLASALDARDRYTSGHSHRVSELSCAVARAMHLSSEDIGRIRIGALLHDIGKIGIADSVLQKPGKLTRDEFAIIMQHPEIGRRILEGVHGFAPFLPAVELHHENWDGTGYPKGQAGEQTPIDARIIHVCDAYDAMTTDRPYRSGMRSDQAVHILRANAGTQFDPSVVECFSSLPQIVEAEYSLFAEAV